MKNLTGFAKLIAAIMVAFLANQLHAVPIFAPGDFIKGGQSDGVNFNEGVAGISGGVNNWPGAEGPENAINGIGQKYLNLGELDTGFIVTPNSPSIVNSITFWTANDAEPRDPASYQLFGTNANVSGGGSIALSDFTQISSAALNLPSSRNAGGGAPLLPANSQTDIFANTNAYASYLVLFPTVKDGPNANSMQIAEVQLDGILGVSVDNTMPEPITAALSLMGLGVLGMVTRRRA